MRSNAGMATRRWDVDQLELWLGLASRRHAGGRPDNCVLSAPVYCLATKITWNISTADMAAGADADFVGAFTPALKVPAIKGMLREI